MQWMIILRHKMNKYFFLSILIISWINSLVLFVKINRTEIQINELKSFIEKVKLEEKNLFGSP